MRNKVGPGTEVLYGRGSGIVESDNEEASNAEAVAVAKRADVAVLFVGTNQLLEGEGRDRTYINLPAVQLQLVRRGFAANPKTVGVLLNGGPGSFSGGPNRPAVVEMFFAGEEGEKAISAVVVLHYNSSLTVTY